MSSSLTAARLRSSGSVAGLGFALLLGADPALAQCAMCAEAAAASPKETRQALNYAILGLAMAPYAVAAVAAWVASPALRAYLRARLRPRALEGAGKEPL